MSRFISAVPTSTTPLALIFQHETRYWSCISTVEQRDGWVAFHNQQFLSRIDPNHAGEFRARVGQSPAIVQDILEFYQTLGAVPAAYVDLLATPEDLIPQLRKANFQEWTGALADLMLYVGPDEARPMTVDVEVVETAPAKEAWASLMDEEYSHDAQLQELYRTQISDPRMVAYLIRVAGEPASRCQLFSSQDLGRIEAVRTSTAYQGRGLAAAVIRQALYDSLQQNHITYIYAEPGSNAQRLYHRLGFRTVAQKAIRGFLWQG
jgi:ribosomal protein S18 acetylase RimI-like enzyme